MSEDKDSDDTVIKFKNFAKDKAFAAAHVAQLLSEFNMLRSERKFRESGWQAHYDAWSNTDLDPEGMRSYRGRANIQLPQIRKEVETMSRRLQKATFPEDYLKAESELGASKQDVTATTMVVRHFLDKVMNIRSKALPHFKQSVLYGTSPMRTYWRKEANEILYKKRVWKEKEGQILTTTEIVKELVHTYNAPFVRTEDMFDVYVYPTNASHPSEIEKVFFRTKITKEKLLEKKKLGLLANESDIEGMGKSIDYQYEEAQQRLQAFGESGLFLGTDAKSEYFDLLEVWSKCELPGIGFVPHVTEIINETVPIRITRNPFWHQSHPFSFLRFIVPPGPEFYGRGLPEASIHMQAQLNDTLNQTMDSVNLSLNNVTIVNPAYAPNQESFEIEQGAIWWADPQSVKQMEFPDLSVQGMRNAASLRQIITEMSDNQPQLPDPIAGKARSTGQAQLAINEWQTDLYSIVNSMIEEGWIPMVSHVHSLLQANLDDDEIIRVSGRYSDEWLTQTITPADIAGRYKFNWIGAIQVENQSVKTQQMLNFLKIFPMIPQNENIKIKWENLLIKLFRDGFNIKDVENIISTPMLSGSTSPLIENKIIMGGGIVEVSDSDDDDIHIKIQSELLEHKDPQVRFNAAAHIDAHKKSKDAKLRLAQMATVIQAQFNQQQQMAGQPGRPPQDLSQKIRNPNGNQGQISETTSPEDLNRGLR